MDAEIKAKWVEALRSGRYEQTTGFLRRSNGRFCCLGVLCDVRGTTIEADRRNEEAYQSIAEFLGEDQMTELWYRNDGAHGHYQHSFGQIAEWIEANL